MHVMGTVLYCGIGMHHLSVQVMRVCNKEHYPEDLKWVKFSSIAWTHDHKGFFYQVHVYKYKLDTET